MYPPTLQSQAAPISQSTLPLGLLITMLIDRIKLADNVLKNLH